MNDRQSRQGKLVSWAILGFLTIAAVLLVLWWTQAQGLRDRVKQVETVPRADVEPLLARIKALEDRTGKQGPPPEALTALESRLSALEQRVAAPDPVLSEVEKLGRRVGTLEQKSTETPDGPDVGTLLARLKRLEGQAAALGSAPDVGPLTTDVANLKTSVAALQREVSGLVQRLPEATDALPIGTVVAWIPQHVGEQPPKGWRLATELDGRFLFGASSPAGVGVQAGALRVRIPEHYSFRSSASGPHESFQLDGTGPSEPEVPVQPLLPTHRGVHPILTKWPYRSTGGWMELPLPPHLGVRFIRKVA